MVALWEHQELHLLHLLHPLPHYPSSSSSCKQHHRHKGPSCSRPSHLAHSCTPTLTSCSTHKAANPSWATTVLEGCTSAAMDQQQQQQGQLVVQVVEGWATAVVAAYQAPGAQALVAAAAPQATLVGPHLVQVAWATAINHIPPTLLQQQVAFPLISSLVVGLATSVAWDSRA